MEIVPSASVSAAAKEADDPAAIALTTTRLEAGAELQVAADVGIEKLVAVAEWSEKLATRMLYAALFL